MKSIDHIVLMVKDVKRTEEFYSKFLGEPSYRDEEQVVYKVGEVRLFFALPYTETATYKYDKGQIGLNHIALSVETGKELREFDKLLTKVGIEHSAPKQGEMGNRYIWFDDPDGLRFEIYHRLRGNM